MEDCVDPPPRSDQATRLIRPSVSPAIAIPFPGTEGSRVFLIPLNPRMTAARPATKGMKPRRPQTRLAMADPLVRRGAVLVS